MINAIFACGPDGEFGVNGTMPWDHIPEDMRFFFKKTHGTTLLMGYNTWDTLPITASASRPFIVVTSREGIPACPHTKFITYQEALNFLQNTKMNVSVIGGSQLLVPEVLDLCDNVYLTEVENVKDADTYLLPETLAYVSAEQDKFLIHHTPGSHSRYKL